MTKHQNFCLPGFGHEPHPITCSNVHAPKAAGNVQNTGSRAVWDCCIAHKSSNITQTQSITTRYVIAKTCTHLGSRNVSCDRKCKLHYRLRVCMGNNRQALLIATWQKDPMQRVPAVQSSSGTLPTSLIHSSCRLKIPIIATYAASSDHGLSLGPPWEVLITCCRETSQKDRSTNLQTFLSHVKVLARWT